MRILSLLATLVVALTLSTSLIGCGSPLRSAVEVANYSAEAGVEAQRMVHDDCTLPMQALAQQPASPERAALAKTLASTCDPVEDAYDVFRRAHLALVAGIVAAQSDNGITIGEIMAITDDVAQSVSKLEKAIRAQHTGGAP